MAITRPCTNKRATRCAPATLLPPWATAAATRIPVYTSNYALKVNPSILTSGSSIDKENHMSRRIKEYGLVAIGLVAGILVSLNFSAVADKDTQLPLPV